jgi:hypothetical protein
VRAEQGESSGDGDGSARRDDDGKRAAAGRGQALFEFRLARIHTLQRSLNLHAGKAREAELEERLAAAEATIAALQAQASTQTHESLQAQGRKTPPAGLLVGKGAVALEAGALDAALESLTIEQRFAVKAGLLRGGLLG